MKIWIRWKIEITWKLSSTKKNSLCKRYWNVIIISLRHSCAANSDATQKWNEIFFFRRKHLRGWCRSASTTWSKWIIWLLWLFVSTHRCKNCNLMLSHSKNRTSVFSSNIFPKFYAAQKISSEFSPNFSPMKKLCVIRVYYLALTDWSWKNVSRVNQ